MRDESFENLEALLQQKRRKIVNEIENMRSKIEEIDQFIESGKGE